MRQSRKLLTETQLHDPSWLEFLQAVNNSYVHFDENRVLVERAMRLAGEEISEANVRLREETENQRFLIEIIKKAIAEFRPDAKIIDERDLIRVADVLREAVEERKHIEQQLVEAREMALSSLQARQVFLANVSHEIRTPIHAIGGLSSILLDTDLSEGQRQYMEVIKTSAEGLTRIINDLLDISKMESGKFTLECIPFSIRDQIRSTIDTLRIRAAEKNIELQVDIDAELPEWSFGDPIRLSQVLLNIADNALKFTEKGEVRIRATVSGRTEDEVNVHFEISDTGVGIDPSKLSQIFDQFTQEDESVTRKFGGTGLGLAISKTLIELLGGKIEVESEKGKGSRFWFTLPFRRASKPTRVAVAEEVPDFRDSHILVVDDNDLNCFLATTILSRWNVRTDTAENGPRALELLGKNRYDLVLLDIQMPVMDGHDVVRFIRAEIDVNLPVIAVSAHATREERERSLQAGMTDYLAKPFRPDELAACIRPYCEVRKLRMEGKEEPLFENFSLIKLHAMFGGNQDHIAKTVQVFVDQLDSEGSLLEEYITHRDYTAIAGVCHKLDPNLILFSASRAQEELERIRQCAHSRSTDELSKRIALFLKGIERLAAALRAELAGKEAG